MFLSGFLLFLVEPMIAKMVLPILGGVPMRLEQLRRVLPDRDARRVWIRVRRIAVAEHASSRPSARRRPQRRSSVLPIIIQAGAVTVPDGNPIGWPLLLLTRSVGLPFFVLSTSASVLQHWLSRTNHPSARDPYFLYSASNLGCLLALACYPTVVEPVFPCHAARADAPLGHWLR